MYRPLSHLFLFFAILLSACGEKSAVRIGPSGGTVERGQAKVEFPAEALVREQAVELNEAGDVTASSYTPAGPAFILTTEQAMFARPVTVTLPIDASRLPPGTLPEQVTAMLAQDGLGERLEGTKVDLAAGTLTVMLERAVPLVHTQGAAAPASPPVLQAAVGPVLGVVLNTNQAIYKAPPGLADAALLAAETQGALKLVLERYKDINAPQPGKLVIEFLDVHERWLAFTTAANLHYIGIQVAGWKSATGSERVETLAHEYFHIIQHLLVERNLKKTGTMVRPEIVNHASERWLYEATATWMETHLVPSGGKNNLNRLTRNFSYLPLNQFDDITDKTVPVVNNPHQYSAFIFFSYLDSLYVGRKIVIEAWSDYLSGAWTRVDLATDAGQGRGSFSHFDVLDRILQATPDNQGRRRSLREVYADFLLHYNWFKDFGPIAGGAHKKELGEAKDLVLPGRIVAWSLPFEENNKLQLHKTLTVDGGPYGIAKAFHIKNQLDAKAGHKGDLEVRLGLAARADPKESLLIVFPFKRGVEDPLIGNAQSPVLVQDWQDYIGAVVWVVDVSANGGWDLTMTAEVKKAKPRTADAPSFNMSVKRWEGESHAVQFYAYIDVDFAKLPGDEALMKTEAGAKRVGERLKKWREAVKKEIAGGRKWVHLTVTIGDRTSHLYHDLAALVTHDKLEWSQEINLPRTPGDYQALLKTSIMGQEVTQTFPIKVRPDAEDERRARETIRYYYEGGAVGGMAWQTLEDLGKLHELLLEDKEALATWDTALARAPSESIPGIQNRLAEHALLVGDIAGYLSWKEKAGAAPDKWEVAFQMVMEKNDCAGARAWLRGDTEPRLSEAEIDYSLKCPKDGDTVVK